MTSELMQYTVSILLNALGVLHITKDGRISDQEVK